MAANMSPGRTLSYWTLQVSQSFSASSFCHLFFIPLSTLSQSPLQQSLLSLPETTVAFRILGRPSNLQPPALSMSHHYYSSSPAFQITGAPAEQHCERFIIDQQIHRTVRGWHWGPNSIVYHILVPPTISTIPNTYALKYSSHNIGRVPLVEQWPIWPPDIYPPT